MKKSACLSLLFGFVISTTLVMGQDRLPPRAQVLVPDTSVVRLGDLGMRAHTNHVILMGRESVGTSPKGETPASLACVYALVSPIAGCPVKGTIANPSGGSGTIAIVDAYDYPTAEKDLGVFSSSFGLPPCTTANGCFKRVYASGKQPKANCGWAQEAALDIEWAHAMAPNAKIVLVEAASNSFTDLFRAVAVASSLVSNGGTGYGMVSMSWGGSEFSSEAGNDSLFTMPGVVYLAASGDTGGKTIYPGVSPNVVSAGGTSVKRDGSGNFTSETGWSGSGGGPSRYEVRPPYQTAIVSIVGTQRSTPDFSFDADPYTGVSVYDSTSCQGASGWMVFGGTSVASPSLSGIVNLAGHVSAVTLSAYELATIYSNLGTGNFRDIVSGTAGSYSAKIGWDFVTGVGSDQGVAGK